MRTQVRLHPPFFLHASVGMSATTVRRHLRSSIVLRDDDLLRVYHDTGRCVPLPVTVDARGTLRTFENRTVDSLQDDPDSQHVPEHLRRAADVLERERPKSVVAFAHQLGVAESTAWCYLCRLVELLPHTVPHARAVVFPPLFDALRRVDSTGSLREVMQRLNDGPLRGDTDWRCVHQRFAHLRLARLCATRRDGQIIFEP